MDIAVSAARDITRWPMPLSPSTNAVAGAERLTVMFGRLLKPPALSRRTYWGSRNTPCASAPVRSASPISSAHLAASSRGNPAALSASVISARIAVTGTFEAMHCVLFCWSRLTLIKARSIGPLLDASLSRPSRDAKPTRPAYINFRPQEPAMNKRVVIVGAGFGGLSAAKALARAPFDVTLIDQHNYHLFQPLLYQVATAGLSPADIASPIRSILRDQKNTKMVLARVSGIDTARREVIAEEQRYPYDHLIIATGAQHAYFGHDEWAAFAPGLKTIDDATYIRGRILLAFEKAETEPDPEERARLLNFVIVGGGPTGVEMAGAIAELANRALAKDFRLIDPRCARIILVEAAPRLLTPFDPSLSEGAKRSLEQLGVGVRLGAAVTAVDSNG